MTAFVIDIRRERLAVAADTCGYVVGEVVKPLGFTSKVVSIPHLRAVLFGRGITAIGHRAGFDLMLSPTVHTIEEAAEALPAMLRVVTEEHAEANGIADHRELQVFEAVFGGYSERDRRVKLWTFYNYRDDYAPEEFPEGAIGTVIMPVLPPEFALPPAAAALPLDKRLIAGMQAAKRYFLANCAAIVGGEIQVTEANAAGVACRTVARFADYEETAKASAAVAARILRGDDMPDVRDGLVAVDDLVTAGGGASRAERRRAEKMARKAGRRAA